MFNRSTLGLAIMLIISACSPVMEANRPDPVDMTQFTIGEDHLKVVAAIGSPLATEQKKKHHEDDDDDDDSAKGKHRFKDTQEAAAYCDLYKLYTRGPDGTGKGAIAAGEAVADVLTLGLTEIVFTPVEAGTKNTKHAVTFCYDDDDKLVSMDQSEGATGE